MSKKPLISIITVCYNEEKTIEKTCKSVANQSSKDFEWIVIDGKSTDKTMPIVQKYNKNISCLVSEKDNGVYDAMNKGIKKSKGDYLLFLNGGDFLYEKNTIQNVLNFIEKDKKQNDLYYGDAIYSNREKVSFEKAKLDKKFFKNKTISHQSTFIKKNLFERFGYYDIKYKIVADLDFWVKTIVKNKAKVKYLPHTISIFDLSGISSNHKHSKKHIQERINVMLKYGIIEKSEIKKEKNKWLTLVILKRLGLYNFIRRNYRKVVRR